MSFLPRIWGRNQVLQSVLPWGSHFSKCLGRSIFAEKFEFYDFCLRKKSDFWQFTALLGISDINNQKFLQPWCNNAQISILPTLFRHTLMFSKLTKIGEGGCWKTLLKIPLEKSPLEELEDFALGRTDPGWHYVGGIYSVELILRTLRYIILLRFLSRCIFELCLKLTFVGNNEYWSSKISARYA